MANRRNRIPGVPVDAERNINQATESLDARLRRLEAKPGRAQVVTGNTSALPGEFLNIEAPPTGLTVILPEPLPSLRDARITLCFRNNLPVRLVSIRGLVNREEFVISSAIGTFEAVCDGLDGWGVETGVSSSGSATDAQYVLGAAHGSLPNAAVGTDSTEVDFSFTPGGLATWALRAASVVFAKLQDLTGLSVLGRAANSAGVMAAITATTLRQVLRVNDGGTALEWGNPVEFLSPAGVDLGDAYSMRFNSGTRTTATLGFSGGKATIQYDWAGGIVQVNDADYNTATQTWDYNSSTSIIPVFPAAVGSEANIAFQRAALSGFVSAAQNVNTTQAAGFRLNGTLMPNPRGFVNMLSTTSCLAGGVDDAVNDELELSFQRAALSGAIAALQNSNATLFAGIQNGGAATTDRTNLNFIGFTVADDLANDRINITNVAPTNVLDVAGVGPHNNLALPTGTTAIRFTSGATLTGIDTTGLPNGYALDLFTSGGTATLTVTNNDALSLAGNKIVTPGDENYAAIRGGGRLVLDTIATTTVWRMSSSAGGLTPNLREISTAVASGNLGTINIATLTCGGTYRITSASGSFSIEGFTAKDVGFWFWFSYGEGAAGDSCTLFNEDVTATAANRLKLPGRASGNDMVGLELRGMFVYTGDLRWTWVGADPNRIGFNDANGVTVAANGAITLNTASTDIDLNSGAGIDLVTTPTTGVPVARLNGVPLGFCAEARLTTRTAVAASLTAADVVSLTIPANFAVAGTSWRLQAHVRYDRTVAGVASNMNLVVDVGGTDVAIVAGACGLVAGNNGSAKLDCVISFLSAPSGAAAYSVSCVLYNSLSAVAPVVSMTVPDATLTVATNAALTIAVQVFFSVAAATNLTRTALMGSIQRVS